MANSRPQPDSCAICGKKALYAAGFKGFCRDHKSDAQKAMRENNRIQESRNWPAVFGQQDHE